ncbi:MAG: helix-turn-helix transcriptional regulator [Clostridia bacterium]|nr:helix-turn-helix transcriptional regulator [Clostridia bacterium]
MIEYDRNAVGRVVRQLRKERGLSQEVFSGLCGLASNRIAMIERGTKQANFETLWKIANACEILSSRLVEQIEREIRK